MNRISIFLNTKVRYVARWIYKKTSRVIGLNVIYLLIFNSHNTKHGCERERERARITVRGEYPNPS